MSGATSDSVTADILSTQVPAAVAQGHTAETLAGISDGSSDRATSLDKKFRGTVDAVSVPPSSHDGLPNPTPEEQLTLRKVPGSIPMVCWLLCLVEFAERASFYGAKTVFTNFLEYPLPKGGNGAGAIKKGSEQTAGALGKGLQFANAFVLLFSFLAYVVPIGGAWLADVKYGRFKTIAIGVVICFVSHIIMIFGALPSVLQAYKGLAPFIVSLLVLALGAGIFKPNVAPLILDQYTAQKPYTRVLDSGEKVIVDPEATVNQIMLVFYALINVGAFFALATTYAEKDVGYWLAFLLPTILFMLLPLLLAFMYKRLVKVPPSGSELTKFVQVCSVVVKENGFKFWKKDYWAAAMPSKLAEKGITTFGGKPIRWSDKFVDDVSRMLDACKIFLYFPIYNLNDNGIGSVANNQGSTMLSKGAPNDLLSNFNPITIIVAVPILNMVVYPFLRRNKIAFGPIKRITFGFCIACLSGVIGTIVQYRVYETNPCGYQATSCVSDGKVSPIRIWWQVPVYSLGALSECFCNVTAYELAYARSPKSMRALVVSLFLFTTALSSALGEILSPVIKDPYLIWVWAGPAIALFVQTGIFWFRYKHLDGEAFMTTDEDEDTLNDEEASQDIPARDTAVEEKKAGAEDSGRNTSGTETPVPENI
ncbi:POT family-domain-containing protein [Phyllosticta citribraziliensis]|uniref:POT family-domain-containing protein n=1 Tax=Phyllosticta citribraziliensis TaxID=989973 RepID=A0ABR1LHH8_9PEZI